MIAFLSPSTNTWPGAALRLALSTALLPLAGCGETWEATSGQGVAATPLPAHVSGYCNADKPGGENAGLSPLDQANCGCSGGTTSPDQNKQCVAFIISDSEAKCGTFIHSLVRNQVGLDTGLDLATTITSAVSNVVGPAAVARGIGAVTSITSGAKTAIDADVYAKASIANYAHAIQSTYYKDMAAYQDEIQPRATASAAPAAGDAAAGAAPATPPSASPAAAPAPTGRALGPPEFELSLIRPIHEECSLASAQATISASITPAQPTGDGGNTSTPATPAAGASKQTPSPAASSPGGRCRVPGHAVGTC